MTAARMRWDATEYREDPALNQSRLKDFVKDRELYVHQHVLGDAPEKKEPAHFAFGTMLETLVFHNRIPAIMIPAGALNDKGHRKGKDWIFYKDQMVEQHGPDVRLITEKEWGSTTEGGVFRAREKLREHPTAAKLIWTPGTEIHPRLLFELDDQACKCELDLVSPLRAIADLKTTKCKSRREFSRDVLSLGYHIQAFWYREAWRQLTGETLPFIFVTIRNEFPYTVEVYELSDDWLELGEQQARKAMAELRECEATGNYKTPDFGKIQQLDQPPRWAWQ